MSRWLILAEGGSAGLFDPLDLVRPTFMLRSGIWTVGERWRRLLQPDHVVVSQRSRLSEAVTEETGWTDNVLPPEDADDLWLVVGVAVPMAGSAWDTLSLPSDFRWMDGHAAVIRFSASSWRTHRDAVIDWNQEGRGDELPPGPGHDEHLPIRGATGLWDLITHLEEQLRFDAALWLRLRPDGESVTEVPRPYGAESGDGMICYGRNVEVHPTAVLDASAGPIICDDGVRIEPYTDLRGPAYIGVHSTLLGGKFEGGTAIGPGCRIAGEWEASIAQGFANKAHAGFFGHGFLGEWVNLGAMTTNSDLKNTYGTVRVVRNGGTVDTGCVKLGSFIADHSKTGIGTLLPTGATVGVGVNVFGGGMCPMAIPHFIWQGPDKASEHELGKMLQTAATVVARRKDVLAHLGRPETLTAAQERLLRNVFELTAGRRQGYCAEHGATEMERR
ncbi:MAG TPA: putative sugar nucleotidyl transferase [Acidobacteriota bacterium]|nr:putative sugar nucleotidyl transferase [Acidobacteriota bacterium]